MAWSLRRPSEVPESNRITNKGNRRSNSIDMGTSSTSIASSRRFSTDNSNESHVQATVVAQGPPVAFFGSCVIGNTFYIHGGVQTRGDRAPSNRMFKFQNNRWTEITTDDSPTLSYHRCLVMGNGQYIVAIGGWDGSKRKSDVYIYDVVNGTWSTTHTPGFPSDGGLNNHAVIPMKSKESLVLVIGRDGSLRTQRRHGDAYCLRGDPIKRNFR